MINYVKILNEKIPKVLYKNNIYYKAQFIYFYEAIGIVYKHNTTYAEYEIIDTTSNADFEEKVYMYLLRLKIKKYEFIYEYLSLEDRITITYLW